MKIDPHIPSGGPLVLTLTELRVLSGLSRGAAMPFEDSISIGSDFACDLILVDPGIAGEHAVLTREANDSLTLRLLAVEGTKSKSSASHAVQLGEAFDMGGVRLIVCQSDADWDFSLPVTAPEPLSAIEAAVADGVAAGRLGRGAAVPVITRPAMNMKQMLTVGGGVAVVALLALLAFFYFDADPVVPAAAPPVAPRVYSEAEVQAVATAFALRLDELNILALRLVTAPQQMTIQGAVDRNAEGRFEGAVQELRNSHPGLKVKLDLGGEGASALPFDITAAVGGSNGSVLLSDGQQLFVGAEEAGFKFLGLVGNCLNFLQVATQQKVSQCADQTPRRR